MLYLIGTGNAASLDFTRTLDFSFHPWGYELPSKLKINLAKSQHGEILKGLVELIKPPCQSVAATVKNVTTSATCPLIPLEQHQCLDLLLKLVELAVHLLHRGGFGFVEVGRDGFPHQFTLAFPGGLSNLVELVYIGLGHSTCDEG